VILLTTSRRPTVTIRAFCRSLEKTIPGVVKISRGKSSIEDLMDRALQLKAKKIVIIDRSKGGPSRIGCYVTKDGEMIPFAPTLHLGGMRIVRERLTTVSCITFEESISAEAKKSAEEFARLFDLNISTGQRDLRTSPALHVSPHGTHGAKVSFATEKGPGKSFIIVDRTVA
jgi:hypothetical protein